MNDHLKRLEEMANALRGQVTPTQPELVRAYCEILQTIVKIKKGDSRVINE